MNNLSDSGSSNPADLNGHSILVVDDYPVNRKIIESILTRLGCNIDEAEDGESALELLAENNYSAILMDLNMSGMDGLEATRQIRQLDSEKRDIPVIAITATVREQDIIKCQEAGMVDFIAKPFSKNELIEKVTAAITEKPVETEYSDVMSNHKMSNLVELTDGDADMMLQMMEVFISQTPELFREIEEKFEQGEYLEMSKLAHTLKPTFNYMNREKGYELSLKLETTGREDNPEDQEKISKLINQLREEATRSIEEVQRMKEEFNS